MTVEERIELIDAARANLNVGNQRLIIAMIDGRCRDDPDAVRGAIWEYSEMEMQAEDNSDPTIN